MKRFFIALAVLGVFAMYSLGIRSQAVVIGKPTLTAANNSSTTVASGGSNPPAGLYKDGTYTGSVADAYYGNVQVDAIVSGGKITSVKFLQYPNTHSYSVDLNHQAMPYLQQEAIQAQNSNVQIISGATYTSQAFVQSLSSALSQAKA